MNIGKTKFTTTIPASSSPADPNHLENSPASSTVGTPSDTRIQQRSSQALEQHSRSDRVSRKNEHHLSRKLLQASLHKQLTENRVDAALKGYEGRQVPQLKMQMIIEHMIKAEQMASNLSKKLQSTAQAIVSKVK